MVPKYTTDAEVRVIVNDILLAYEERIGQPRHEDNIEKFDKLFSALNQVKGVLTAFGLIYTAFQIYQIVTKH